MVLVGGGGSELNPSPEQEDQTGETRTGCCSANLDHIVLLPLLICCGYATSAVDCSKVEDYECKMMKWIKAFQSGKYADNDEIARKVDYFQ